MGLLQSIHFHATLPFPVSKEKRQEYITVAGERAATLAERIENFTGKQLDYRGVKDIEEYFAVMRADARQDLSVSERLVLELLVLRNRARLFWAAETGYFMQHTGTIYAAFGSATKGLLFYEGPRHHFLDSLLLHELGHVLWTGLGGERAPATLTEGFVSYCSLDWFADFAQGKPFASNDPIYKDGRALITYIVAKLGKRALFDLPKNWQGMLAAVKDDP